MSNNDENNSSQREVEEESIKLPVNVDVVKLGKVRDENERLLMIIENLTQLDNIKSDKLKALDNQVNDLSKANEDLKTERDKIADERNLIRQQQQDHKCSPSLNPEILKYKEFFSRCQTHCKELENYAKKVKETHLY